MSERKYELNELSELYYQGFFKNTKIGQKIDDKLDAYSDKVLKEHEKEMADFVKSLSPKVESVQFDWDSMEVGQVGNGTPQGGGYMMTVNGRINNNKDTKFTLGFPLKRNLNEIPEKLVIIQMQPIRILKGNLWDLYE